MTFSFAAKPPEITKNNPFLSADWKPNAKPSFQFSANPEAPKFSSPARSKNNSGSEKSEKSVQNLVPKPETFVFKRRQGTKKCYFGKGQDSRFLHPSDLTYKSDFAVKSNDKYILLDEKYVSNFIPYFDTFNRPSAFKEQDLQELVCSKTTDKIKVRIIEINQFDPDVLCEYFRFHYTKEISFTFNPTGKVVNPFNPTPFAFQIYEIADYFQDEDMLDMCIEYLAKNINKNNFLKAWKIARLQEECKKFLKDLTKKKDPLFKLREIHSEEVLSNIQQLSYENFNEFAALMLENSKTSESMFDTKFHHFSKEQMLFVVTEFVERNDIASEPKIMGFVDVFNWSVFDYCAKKNFYELLVESDIKSEKLGQIYEKFFGHKLPTANEKRAKIKRKIELISKASDNKFGERNSDAAPFQFGQVENHTLHKKLIKLTNEEWDNEQKLAEVCLKIKAVEDEIAKPQ